VNNNYKLFDFLNRAELPQKESPQTTSYLQLHFKNAQYQQNRFPNITFREACRQGRLQNDLRLPKLPSQVSLTHKIRFSAKHQFDLIAMFLTVHSFISFELSPEDPNYNAYIEGAPEEMLQSGEPIKYYVLQAEKLKQDEKVTMFIDFSHLLNYRFED
jgi:hypothetical protein